MNVSKNYFTNNLGWKILSLVIAVGLWFTVINTENPLETRSFTTSVQIENQDSLFERGYVAVNEEDIKATRITVRLRGQRLALDTLSQSSTKVQAKIDLSNVLYMYNGEPVSVPIDIVIPSVVNNSFEILSKSIQSVTVDIQPYINKEFPISEVISHSDVNTVEKINALATPETVTVYGAKSIVNSISEVRAEVVPETIEEGMVIAAVPKAYDSEGNLVKKVSFSSNEILVTLNMDASKKSRVIADVVGNTAEGYEITNVNVSPEIISVAGEEEDLFNFNLLRLPEIDVEGIDRNIQMTYAIEEYLPEGIRLLKNATGTDTITVTVVIEEERSKEITVDSDKMIFDNLGIEYTGNIIETNIVFNVKGSEEVMAVLIPENFEIHMDCEGFGEGLHENVPVIISLPEGVELVGDMPLASVHITRN